MRLRRPSAPSLGQASLLLVAAMFSPLRIWADNMVEVGIPSGLVLWGILVWLAALLLWLLAVGLGGDEHGITRSIFWLLLIFSLVGPLTDSIAGGIATLVAAIIIVAFVSYRLRDVSAFHILTNWAAVFALLLPIGTALFATVNRGEVHIAEAQNVAVRPFSQPRDVVIVVFDAHGSLSTLDAFYDFDAEQAERRLLDAGIASYELTSNYTLTFFSLASFFEMDYPIVNRVGLGEADREALLDIIHGDSNLVDAFRSQGYRFVLVESGWSAIRCSTYTDVCIEGTWPDDATSEAIRKSLIPDSIPFLKDSFAGGSIKGIEWLREELPAYVDNGSQELIFVHLMIPHPPLLLDSECEYRWDADLTGSTLNHRWMTDSILDERRAAYLEQVDCAQDLIVDMGAIVGEQAILLAIADHGPDSRRQLTKQPTEWDVDDTRERFGILFATNAIECGFEDVASLVNVGRTLLSCMSGEHVARMDDRYFILTTPQGPAFEIAEPIAQS